MTKTTCIYTDKQGNNHIIKSDKMKSKISIRILEEGKIQQKEQRKRMHEMKKEDREYER